MGQSLLSLLFQLPCPLCQRPSREQFCRDCTGQILEQRFPPSFSQWQGEFPRFVWGGYEAQLKQAIATMKFKQQPRIGVWLGEQLAQRWLEQPQAQAKPRPQVAPIPLHASKEASRGFNQAERIAFGFCRLTGYALRPRALQRVKNTKALFDLSPGDRQQQLKSALTIGPQFNPHTPWLIVDDIVTTGSTAQEARQVIQHQGGQVMGLVAIAAPSFSRPPEHPPAR